MHAYFCSCELHKSRCGRCGHKSLVYVSSFSSCIIINELRACSKEVSQHLSKIVLPQSYPEEPRFLKQNLVSITAQLSKLIIFVFSGSSTQWWDSRLSLRGYAGRSHYYAGHPCGAFPALGKGKDLDTRLFHPKPSFPSWIWNFFKSNINSIILTRVRPRCMKSENLNYGNYPEI